MRYPLAILALLFCIVKLYGQESPDPALQSLVNAERAFIRQAKETNTRDAFMSHLADDAITFGKDFQKGKDYLKAQTPNESWLYWEPVYSDISSSGDLGFNTGPWEFRSKRTDEKAVAFGQFITIWKKVNGEWKAAVDLGISHAEPTVHGQWKTSSMPSKKSNAKGGNAKQEMLDVEKNFISNFMANNHAAYKDVLSAEARLYRGGSEPKISQTEISAYLSSADQSLTFNPVDAFVSSAGDMGFVYGRSITRKTLTGEAKEYSGFYMRIWKKESGKWKIVVDIVS